MEGIVKEVKVMKGVQLKVKDKKGKVIVDRTVNNGKEFLKVKERKRKKEKIYERQHQTIRENKPAIKRQV